MWSGRGPNPSSGRRWESNQRGSADRGFESCQKAKRCRAHWVCEQMCRTKKLCAFIESAKRDYRDVLALRNIPLTAKQHGVRTSLLGRKVASY